MEDKIKKFYEKSSDLFKKRIGKPTLDNKIHFGEVAKHIKKGKVLDVGCRYGEAFFFLKDKGIEYVGLDISENGAEIARKQTGCKIYTGNALKMPFKDKTFDYVFLCELIEHMASPLDLLEECKRVVKSGGLIIGTTPNPNSFVRNLASIINYWNWQTDPGHLQTFSKPEIENLAKITDLKLVLLKTLYFNLPKIKHDFSFLLKFFPFLGNSLFFVMKK